MDRGWVRLWRKSFDSAVWTDPNLWRTWTCCLLLANHGPGWAKVSGLAAPVEVKPGQFITGRFEFHQRMFPKRKKSDPDPKTVWRWLQTLESMQNLTIKSTNKFSVITISNWPTYQNGNGGNAQQDVQQTPSRCPAGVQQAPTNKNEKNEENEKNEKNYALSCDGNSAPSVIGLPLVNGSEFEITQSMIDEWAIAYPGLDVMQRLQAMRQWLISNPKRRKTQRGVRGFVTSWLDADQNKIGGRGKGPLTGKDFRPEDYGPPPAEDEVPI